MQELDAEMVAGVVRFFSAEAKGCTFDTLEVSAHRSGVFKEATTIAYDGGSSYLSAPDRSMVNIAAEDVGVCTDTTDA